MAAEDGHPSIYYNWAWHDRDKCAKPRKATPPPLQAVIRLQTAMHVNWAKTKVIYVYLFFTVTVFASVKLIHVTRKFLFACLGRKCRATQCYRNHFYITFAFVFCADMMISACCRCIILNKCRIRAWLSISQWHHSEWDDVDATPVVRLRRHEHQRLYDVHVLLLR